MDNDLLIRYLEGSCSEDDKVEVTKWIEEDPENLKNYLALRKLHDITIWRTGNVEDNSKEETVHTKKRISTVRVFREALKIAAIIALTLIIYDLCTDKKIDENVIDVVAEQKAGVQTLNVPAGQRAEITLGDGTRVWLNAGSTLVFPGQFIGNTREVRLNGEGYFDISYNPENPFVVKTSRFDVKALGTSFNLMAYEGSPIFETMLLEGTVEITGEEYPNKIMLNPEEKVTLTGEKLVVSPIVNMEHLSWKDGIIYFDDETFGDLINRLKLYFDVNIEVQNKEIFNKTYSGKFRTKDGIVHILNVFKLRHNFDFTIDEDTNTITIINL
ncbi:MAG: FecR family protein [Bacteroidales bacterium]|jgi:transmembrane sensor